MTTGIEVASLQRSVPTGSFVGSFDVQKSANRPDASFREAYSQQRYGYETQTTAPSFEGKPSFVPEITHREANPVEDINAQILNNITEIRAYLDKIGSHFQES